jgi:hypothetical protein
MGLGELEMGVLAIDIAAFYEKLPNLRREFRERKFDRLVVSIEHEEKTEIRALLSDARGLRPPIQQHLNALGIAVMPLI